VGQVRRAAAAGRLRRLGLRIAYFKALDFYKKSQRSRVCFSQAMLERVEKRRSSKPRRCNWMSGAKRWPTAFRN